MLKRDKGTNLFATNKPPAQLFSPRGRRKVAHSELFSYLCATQAPGRGAARAHSSVGQSSGLIIRRSWDHAPLGPPDKPEHPEGCPGFCFARQGRGHAVRLLRAVHPPGTPPACTTRPPETPPSRTTRPPETPPRPHDTRIPPFRMTRPAGNFFRRHDTSTGNSSSPARHTNPSLPHDTSRPPRTVRTPPKVVSPPLFAVSPTARTLRFRNNLVPFGIFRIFDVV